MDIGLSSERSGSYYMLEPMALPSGISFRSRNGVSVHWLQSARCVLVGWHSNALSTLSAALRLKSDLSGVRTAARDCYSFMLTPCLQFESGALFSGLGARSTPLRGWISLDGVPGGAVAYSSNNDIIGVTYFVSLLCCFLKPL